MADVINAPYVLCNVIHFISAFLSHFLIITIPDFLRQILHEKRWIPDKKYFVHPCCPQQLMIYWILINMNTDSKYWIFVRWWKLSRHDGRQPHGGWKWFGKIRKYPGKFGANLVKRCLNKQYFISCYDIKTWLSLQLLVIRIFKISSGFPY